MRIEMPALNSALIAQRSVLCAVVWALHFAFCSVADAQQPVKVPRIAYLSGSSFSNLTSRIDAFRQGLREVGYVEGKNIVIEWREAKKLDRVREVADELVGLKMETGRASCRERV